MSYQDVVASQILEMLDIQDETNSRLDENWASNPSWDFMLAAQVEAAEAIDHYGYKWWKSQEPDYDQIRLELVDIWHFYLSEIIVLDEREDYAEQFAYAWTRPVVNSKVKPNPLFTLRNLLNASTELEPYDFVDACDSFGLSFSDLYILYIGKAALNRFRWSQSYGDGYVKIWNGREDNEHLTEIIKSLPKENITINHIVKLLGERYVHAILRYDTL